VQQLISEKLKVALCLTSVGKLLAQLNITPQKPLRRVYERDLQAVALWLAETYPQLKRRAKREGAMIFFLDEAGFQSDPQLGRLLLPWLFRTRMRNASFSTAYWWLPIHCRKT
jgi:hypothetical protein